MSRIIINERIYLDHIQDADAERLALIANDPLMHKNVWDRMPYPYTLDNAKRRISNCKEMDDYDNSCKLGVYIDGEYAGNCGRERRDESQWERFYHNISFGYWIGKEYHWQWLGTQIVQWLSDYILHNVPDCHRLYAKVFWRNMPSRRVLEKCWFALEWTLKEAIFREWTWYDEWILSKINKQ